MWMSDSEIHRSYSHAKNSKEQIHILSQLNGCGIHDIEEAIDRYEASEKLRSDEYNRMLAKVDASAQQVEHHIERESSWIKIDSNDRNQQSTSDVRASSMKKDESTRNPEPISGIKKREKKPRGGTTKKLEVETTVKEGTTSNTTQKLGRGPDTSIRWRRKTVIKDPHDLDWNCYIDSMRSHLEMAKECERQLMRLEKQFGSHRRKKKGDQDG